MSERFVGMDRVLDRLSSVALVTAAATLLWIVLTDRQADTVNTGGVERFEMPVVVDPPPPASVKGDPGARVAIIEFSDFECPFCGQHARDTYPRLMDEYVDTRKVQYVFRHYPLSIHPRAFRAAEAVECAGREGVYWEMHDLVFGADGALAEDDLLRYATILDLDSAAFAGCLKNGVAAERVTEDRQHGEALGVTATPTFFFARVDGDGRLSLAAKVSGLRSYSTFQSVLDELLLED